MMDLDPGTPFIYLSFRDTFWDILPGPYEPRRLDVLLKCSPSILFCTASPARTRFQERDQFLVPSELLKTRAYLKAVDEKMLEGKTVRQFAEPIELLDRNCFDAFRIRVRDILPKLDEFFRQASVQMLKKALVEDDEFLMADTVVYLDILRNVRDASRLWWTRGKPWFSTAY